MVSISFAAQLPEGSLEYAFHHLIEERVEDEWFESLYQSDEIGRPGYSPKLLLKVILLGYARGIIGSRRLERACRENVAFMAMACGSAPDHSTLAAFVGKLQGRIEGIFSQILLVCHGEGLLIGTHLNLDGVKLPGNASRESSGSADFLDALLVHPDAAGGVLRAGQETEERGMLEDERVGKRFDRSGGVA
ncbi:MAG: transposase [Chthoniobacterales bacterium]